MDREKAQYRTKEVITYRESAIQDQEVIMYRETTIQDQGGYN